MRYKKYARAGVEVSELAVGTWAIGAENYGEYDRKEAFLAIREMLDRGVNLIDTAPCYGNGTAEKFVGALLEEIPREKVLISTKVGLAPDIHTRGYRRDGSYKNVMREIESSLMNLGTDYIDFYFVHWPDEQTPISETMAALAELKRKGYIRYVGVSNFSKEQIEEAEKILPIDVQQPPYSMVDRRFEELMKWGIGCGISSMTYGSMGGGILSGKMRTIPNYDAGDIRMTFYDTFREPKFSKIMELLKVMDGIAEKHQATVSEVALNWSTQQEFVTTALVGVRSRKHVEENCASFEWMLEAEELCAISSKIIKLGL